MSENLTEFIEGEEPLDTWYSEMGSRIPKNPEEEPSVGLMEWVDIMVEYKE